MNKFITTTDILVALLSVANIVSAQKENRFIMLLAHMLIITTPIKTLFMVLMTWNALIALAVNVIGADKLE